MRAGRHIDVPDKINWSVFKTLIPYLVEYKSRVFIALSCLILAKVATVSLPFVLKYIVDDLDSEQLQLIAAPVMLVVAYGALRLSSVLLGEVRDTVFGRVTERAMRRVGLRVFNHLHRLDLDFHLNRQTGGLSRDMERGVSGISFVMRFMVFNIVPTLIEFCFVVGILLINYEVSFALIITLAVVSYALFSVKATQWRTRFVRESNIADSTSNTRAIDSLINYETVKYFGNETFEEQQYDKQLALWEQAKRKNRLSLFTLNGGQALIIACAMTAMMGLAASNVVAGNMTIGDFVLINAFTMQIFMPLNFLGFVYREIRGSLANIEQMFTLLTKQSSIADKPSAQDLVLSTGKIDFKDVDFRYHREREILTRVSFSIEPGQKVAVVGASGSGKSTLVKLLFRFYDVTDGTILIDNQDIRDITQASLRQAIGIVPQDTVLFNDTIFDNVRYGRPEASDDEVNRAIDLAHLRGFIESLPDKEKTKVGERGLKLSGGEKQRVAIARTILKQPAVLVFDEATSSLDSYSEQQIMAAINEITADNTSLVIAHRLSTIIDADKILVMKQGKIIEQGTHPELLAQQGEYAKLWQLQQQ
ncbi:ABC transporter ATP-binding protein/permease [Psychrobium sp. 1_MG-2023]|uniref:ABCB family ABC transporter ATP-binding protein/permease n=1 Tax=Psychrobium sp. 1_MG-2023 TaxID=3062624 RepID=UPI000C33A7B3|nr:ABC transporter ATP-binding protein/permease [Psychrobium sp. 1_MG-2023]MDP2561155.1 ABC transporter ATP-binding protein/permease [Psychrobium sp. 1_MG-2023]PKF55129.1 metal ABC transporter permease [Alteromonadales bacterium alter-6D02]